MFHKTKCHRKISKPLSTACCALFTSSNALATTASAELHEITQSKPWAMNIGVGSYVEKDRNTGVEVLIDGRRPIAEDFLNVRFELDVITGATPNGATASNVPQTFTKASGAGSYSVGANELPADDTHMDTRMAVSMFYNDYITSNFSLDYRAHLSMEFDYLSVGAGIDLKQDFNNHNTSLLLGVNYEFNNVHPVGNIPIGFASMQPPGEQQPRSEASTTKEVSGFSLGFNQILTPRSLVQFKYAYAYADGYLTDPYKLLSVIEQPSGSTSDYLYEHRPDKRTMESVFAAYKLFINGDVLDLSYRYYWDDWDLNSNTFDIRYRKKLNDNKFIQPLLRYYTQSAAAFFTHSLPENDPLPDYASADFRLAEFDAYTVGLKFGKVTGENKEHSINLQYYTHVGDSHPGDAIGLQKEQDLFPTLQTLVMFYNYSFNW